MKNSYMKLVVGGLIKKTQGGFFEAGGRWEVGREWGEADSRFQVSGATAGLCVHLRVLPDQIEYTVRSHRLCCTGLQLNSIICVFNSFAYYLRRSVTLM